MRLFLNIDAGTTSIKVSLINPIGALIGLSIQEYHLETPGDNLVELDPEVYWHCCQEGIKEVLRKVKSSSEAVLSVGVCSQGETLIVLDRNNRPLRKAIVWYDSRSVKETSELKDIVGENIKTGQVALDPCWPVTKILWIKNNEPDVYAGIQHYMLVGDYLLHRLSGAYYGDRSLYSSSYMVDIESGVWWDEILDYVGILPEQLSVLCDPGVIVGSVLPEVAVELGLRSGIPVITGGLDQMAAMVGAGNIEEGIVTEATGAALAVCMTVATPSFSCIAQRPIHQHVIPRLFAMMDWCPAGGMSLRWFRDCFFKNGDISYDDLIRMAVKVPPGSLGLKFFPFMQGMGTICSNSHNIGGMLIGLKLEHQDSHIVRAIVEGLAFILRFFVESMEQEYYGSSQFSQREIRSIGGASRDPVWNQMKADITGRRIVSMDSPEAASLGLAILQSVALHIYPDIESAVKSMVRVSMSCSPDPENAKQYNLLFEQYVEDMKMYCDSKSCK